MLLKVMPRDVGELDAGLFLRAVVVQSANRAHYIFILVAKRILRTAGCWESGASATRGWLAIFAVALIVLELVFLIGFTAFELDMNYSFSRASCKFH